MKIGIFDSGIGGLTVFKEISKRLPSFEIIYLGDTARLPYGIKSKKTVDKYSENNLKFLRSLGCQVIVIACNTASSYSTGLLKKKFRIPIFDVLSSGVTASLKTDSNRIGIIGTSSTIESKTYQKSLKRNSMSTKIFSKACPIFVPIIEQGLSEESYSKIIIKENLELFKRNKVQVLILGCTHYPLIKKHIQKFLGKKVILIDSAEEISKSLLAYLKAHHPKEFTKDKRKRQIYVTDQSSYFEVAIKKIFKNLKIKIKLVDIK
ncbi:MAG: glutamate racemase [Thermodesulfobacteriota bacterium]|nr:glutamate racemase [Thermodesulfobacteriota bacterium]